MTTDSNMDVELVRAALTGDVKAFGRLVERHHGAVVAVAFAVTRELATAEDIAQETFCTAWTGLGALRDPGAIRPWLCNIARNRSRNALRAQRREVPSEPTELVDDAASPRDTIVDRETVGVVRAALDDVPATYREPLVLYYWEGQSIEHVAAALAISAQAAQKRISRARTFMKESLASRLAEVGRSRRAATIAAAAIVAVCSTRKVASASGVATSASTVGVPVVAKVAAAFALTVAVVLAVAVAVGKAPWSSHRASAESSSHQVVVDHGSTAAAKTASLPPRLPKLGTRTTAGGAGLHGPTRGGFGTPSAYELSVLDPMHVAVNLAGGPSEVYLFEPPPPPPPFKRTVRGRVVDEAGRPIANAVVLVGKTITTSFGSVMADQGATSAADGSFSVVVHDDGASTAIALHPTTGWSSRVAIPAGSADATLEIRIPAPGSIVGRVTRGGSSIEATITVTPLENNGFDMTLETDTTGGFELSLLAPGRYSVRAFATQQFAGGSSPPTKQEVTVASGKPTKASLELAVGTLIIARAKAPTGAELSTVEYTLVAGTGTFDVASLRQLARAGKAPSYLLGGQDADRDAQFHDVIPGTYTLCVDARPAEGAPWPLVCRLVTVNDRPVLELDVDVKP